MVKFLSHVGTGEATVWKHYLDWDKNVFGPNAKKARIVSKTYESSPREHQYAAGLWADTYPANLSPSFFDEFVLYERNET